MKELVFNREKFRIVDETNINLTLIRCTVMLDGIVSTKMSERLDKELHHVCVLNLADTQEVRTIAVIHRLDDGRKLGDLLIKEHLVSASEIATDSALKFVVTMWVIFEVE